MNTWEGRREVDQGGEGRGETGTGMGGERQAEDWEGRDRHRAGRG